MFGDIILLALIEGVLFGCLCIGIYGRLNGWSDPTAPINLTTKRVKFLKRKQRNMVAPIPSYNNVGAECLEKKQHLRDLNTPFDNFKTILKNPDRNDDSENRERRRTVSFSIDNVDEEAVRARFPKKDSSSLTPSSLSFIASNQPSNSPSRSNDNINDEGIELQKSPLRWLTPINNSGNVLDNSNDEVRGISPNVKKQSQKLVTITLPRGIPHEIEEGYHMEL